MALLPVCLVSSLRILSWGSRSHIHLGVHLALPRLKDSLTNLTEYAGSEVILVDDTGLLILDSCELEGNAPITCPGLMSSPVTPYYLRQSGGVFKRIDNDVMNIYGGWANVTSGRTVTIGRYWITYELIINANLHWIAVILIDSNVYLSEVQQANRGTIIGIDPLFHRCPTVWF